MQKIREDAVLIGKNRTLVGVLTRPPNPQPQARPAILILNAGFVHRVGPNRMHVTMARKFAEFGHYVLRFDFSGIGDSVNRTDQLPLLDAALSEIKAAIDWLTSASLMPQVILIGLCSGADHAVLYGWRDPRVVGLVLLDPSVPPTIRYYWYYILNRLARPRSWLNALFGESHVRRLVLERINFAVIGNRSSATLSLQHRSVRAQLEEVYRKTVEAGIKLLCVFAENTQRHSYRDQLLDAFPLVPFARNLKLEFFEASDHYFTAERDRAKLTKLIIEWASSAEFRHESAAPADQT